MQKATKQRERLRKLALKKVNHYYIQNPIKLSINYFAKRLNNQYLSTMESINLAIIEDGPIIRESLETFMGEHPSINIEFIADSVEVLINTLRVARNPRVDIILLDIGLPGISGLEGIRPIKRLLPNVNIIMLTTYEEDDKIFQALCAGAVSYISKRTPLVEIRNALFTIHRGGSYMSPSIARKVVSYFNPKATRKVELSSRQSQIVEGIVEGLSYKMIADKYLISINTVRDHIKKIYSILEINSKAELIKKSMEREI